MVFNREGVVHSRGGVHILGGVCEQRPGDGYTEFRRGEEQSLGGCTEHGRGLHSPGGVQSPGGGIGCTEPRGRVYIVTEEGVEQSPGIVQSLGGLQSPGSVHILAQGRGYKVWGRGYRIRGMY